MMRSKVLPIMAAAAGIAACSQAPEDTPKEAPVDASALTNTLGQAPASKPAQMIPKPETEAELDRLILAGYTPHADHLHAPGVNECPMSKGTEAVM